MNPAEADELKRRVALANLAAYDSDGARRYVDGAPHIKHADLRALYADILVDVFQQAQAGGKTPTVLDLGAGEGSVTLPMLELGAHVTAVDISAEQLAGLKKRCLRYANQLTVRCEDIAETIAREPGEFDIIVANSFLHHIPDYLGMLRSLLPHLAAGGQFFSFQDPLLYATQPRLGRLWDKGTYAAWRLGKGDVWNGIRRRLRRARGQYLADSAHDNAEYHVVRAGVDHEAIAALFREAGFRCRIIPYFSTQSTLLQSVGRRLGLPNTFAFVATRGSATGTQAT
ncbi:MAG: hypothetical protein RLZZ129_2240 [Verrucomicrobiota bacterium]|jgi:SAM-dependent methyltransferase